MGSNAKIRYEIDLATIQRRTVPEAISLRPLVPTDRDALARLMLDAYKGTIDYEGETLAEAFTEVDSWFAGSPLLPHSFGAVTDDGLRSATLVMELHDEPFIAIVMTHPAVKQRGYGGSVVHATLVSLRTPDMVGSCSTSPRAIRPQRLSLRVLAHEPSTNPDSPVAQAMRVLTPG